MTAQQGERMNRETEARDGTRGWWGTGPGEHAGSALQPDRRKVLDLNALDILELMRDIPHECNSTTQQLVDFLEGARRVRLEVDPRGTVEVGNGFTAAFAAGPGFAHDEPDEVQA